MSAAPHPGSYYAASAVDVPTFPGLRATTRTDVCVIGGGYTGLSCALHLAERGYDVVLLEANRVGWGASGRNGGQLGSGQRQSQDVLERWLGKEHAQRLWALAEEAKATVKERIRLHAIPCAFRPGVLNVCYKRAHAAWCERYVDKLRTQYGYEHIRWVAPGELSEMVGSRLYHGGALDTDAGHLHPLNYALGLARAARAAGVRLHEGARVARYDRREPTTVETDDGGRVEARHVVLACNGYLDRLEPRVAGYIMPINNFILATEPLDEARARALIRDDVAIVDTKFVVDYYRLCTDRRLLFGGGENYTRAFPRDLKAFVRRYMLRVYPQLTDVPIEFAWGGTLAITLRRLPHFGRLPPNVFFAHGFSGHGVAIASFAGKLIAEAVAGSAERFDVFARLPATKFPGGTLLRWPALVAGMLYYSLRDRL